MSRTAGEAASAITPDERAALEDERDFLLASLVDLEREHEAGDVDDHDYAELHDDYTARAARVIRTIEAHEVRAPEPTPHSPARRRLLVAAAIAAFVAVAGYLVADAARERDEGDTVTGDIRETEASEADRLLGEAHQLADQRQLEEAIAAYDRVLELEPDNAEALTYKGWMQVRSGDQSGVVSLIAAVEAHPDYPDARLFLAYTFAALDREDTALQELDRLAELDPPEQIAEAAAALRAQLEAS